MAPHSSTPPPAAPEDPNTSLTTLASPDGHFRRQTSTFRSHIHPTSSPNSPHPAQPNRYTLYITATCPWAHRTLILLHLKNLHPYIQLVHLHPSMGPQGWYFSGEDGTDAQDPVYGYHLLKELYLHADKGYVGRYTVPMLWDKEKETIVNNESSEIVRMLETCFDGFLPEAEREETKGEKGLYPVQLRERIDEMNEWVYDGINNGVYKTGFAATQEAYESNVVPLFEALDRVERHLQGEGHQPYLFGEYITEADVRLFTTLIRFDAAYFTMFKCNVRMIRDESHYPKLHKWLRNLYWNHEAFRVTTNFELIKKGYAQASRGNIVPYGPIPHILPLEA
ncbi:MAG: hypothetical protein Q9220_006955 [cf. Caloplaca sp. 1 TL-2023]